MTLNTNGNVGVGTSTPTSKLSVEGDFTSSGTQAFEMTRTGVARTAARFSISNATNSAGVFLPVFTGVSNYDSSGTAIGMYFTGQPVADNSSDDVALRFDGRTQSATAMTTGAIAEFTNLNTPLLRIMASGKIGIGTTSPSQLLSVQGNGLFSGNLFVGGSITSTSTLYINKTSAASTRESLGKLSVSDAGNDAFYFGNGTSADGSYSPSFSAYVDSSLGGLVLDGITSSAKDNAANALVTVRGMITNNASDPLNGSLSNPTTRGIFMVTNKDAFGTSPYFYVGAAGNVGIGTTSPVAPLSIERNGSSAVISLRDTYDSTSREYRFGSITAGSPLGNQGDFTFSEYNSGSFVGTRLVIQKTTGNVGIGTTSPYARLAVAGQTVSAYFTATTTTASTFPYASSTASTFTTGYSSKIYAPIITAADSGNTNLNLRSNGNGSIIFASGDGNTEMGRFLGSNNSFGVGTSSPSAKLSITSSGTGTGRAFVVANSSNAEKFTILDNGNVGIGSTSPFAKLSVVGGGQVIYGGSIDLATTTPTICSSVSRVYVYGKTLYQGSGDNCPSLLAAIDVSNPRAPRTNGYITSVGAGGPVAVAGKYAYTIGSDFSVIDVSNPSTPLLVGKIPFLGIFTGASDSRAIGISGRYVYIARGDSGFVIVDVADPANPSVAGSYDTPGSAKSVDVKGKYLYVADDTSGLEIFDVSDPTSPLLVGSYNTSGNSLAVKVQDRYAYVADSGGQLAVIDVSNPASPALMTTGGYQGYSVYDVQLSGKYAFIATGGGIAMMDISDPASIVSVAVETLTGANISQISVSGNYVYGSDSSHNTIYIFSTGGLDVPSLQAGSAEVSSLISRGDILGDGNLFISGAFSAGIAGIHSRGTISAYVATTTGNPVAATFMGGKVGVGTTSPASLFTVMGGGACFSGSSATLACGNAAGNLYYRTANTGTYDVAENYAASDASIEAADIVALDEANPLRIVKATRGSHILGAISTDPGLVLGGADATADASSTRPVALSGRVPVKVNGEAGNIAIGDKISISSTAGVGKKAVGSEESIGVALEAWTGTALDQGIVKVFVTAKQQVDQDKFTVMGSGNVGIGTTSPDYKLQVAGDIAATAFVNVSTRAAKKDIAYVDDAARASMFAKLRTVGVATYRYNEESENQPLRMGLIAEEAPAEVLADTGKGVDVYKLSTFILAGVQEMAARMDALDGRVKRNADDIASLQASLADTVAQLTDLRAQVAAGQLAAASASTSATTASTTVTWSDGFGASVLAFFQTIGLKLENGIAYIANAVVETFSANIAYIKSATIESASVEALTVGSAEKRSGITLYDELTGQPYCLTIAGGQTKNAAGECPRITASSTAPMAAPAPGVSGSFVSPASDAAAAGAPQAVQPSSTNEGTTTVSVEPAPAPIAAPVQEAPVATSTAPAADQPAATSTPAAAVTAATSTPADSSPVTVTAETAASSSPELGMAAQ